MIKRSFVIIILAILLLDHPSFSQSCYSLVETNFPSLRQDITCVHLLTSTVGYATGEDGAFLKTTDGGNNWAVISNTFKHVYNLCFLNPDTGFVLGSDTTISVRLLKTINGGISWDTVLCCKQSGDLVTMQFVNDTTGYAISDVGSVYRSTDGGNSWELISTIYRGPNNVNTTFFLDKDTGYVATSSDLYKTTDGCKSWVNCTNLNNTSFSYVKFLNPQVGYAAGAFWPTSSPYSETETIYSTNDYGKTWTQLFKGASESGLVAIEFITDKEWYIIGGRAKVYFTEDAGQNISLLTEDTTKPTIYSTSLNPDSLLLLVAGETMLKLDFCEMATATVAPSASDNTFKIYPNPNQGTFTVVATAYANGNVTVYNAIGAEVGKASPLNGGQLHLNLGVVPSGIYYIELLSDKGRVVQKVIID